MIESNDGNTLEQVTEIKQRLGEYFAEECRNRFQEVVKNIAVSAFMSGVRISYTDDKGRICEQVMSRETLAKKRVLTEAEIELLFGR